MHIYKYLKKIKNNAPINFDVFVKCLEKEGINRNEILQIFSNNKTKKNQYEITVKDQSRFANLLVNFPEQKISDRISAARVGNSHRHSVSKAILTLWPYQSGHPVVILNSDNHVITPVTLSHNLLIIENQENFIQKQNTLDFLMKEIPVFNDEYLDVVFASGNAITNKLNKAFFNHYARIDCLLDLDIGGLEIFQSLDKLTQHPELNFLVPLCAEKLLMKSKINLKEHHLVRLRRLAASCPKLECAFNLIAKTQKMLEQEIYLPD